MADNNGMFGAEEERLALCPPLCAESGMKARRFYRLDESFSGFAGHFPGYAVLPALAQVFFTRLLAERCLGLRLSCRRIKNAKFMGQGLSGDFLRLEVAVERNGDFLELDGAVSRLAGETIEPLDAPESAWVRISRMRLCCAVEENADARDAL